MKSPIFHLRGAALALAVTFLGAASLAQAADQHMTTVFSGSKVNKGTVTHVREGGKQMLTLSEDFQVPGTPDPHWQVVDSKGNVFLLQRLMIKGDKLNRTIVLPDTIQDVAKVQIWCAYAEVLLGEASFGSPVS